MNQFELAPKIDENNYYARDGGELSSQIFPNFPILRERAIYTKNCLTQDAKSEEDSFEKNFPSHAKLTPGLYLMTCGCKGRVRLTDLMNFRKSSERGGVIFNPKIYIAKFGPLNRVLSA